MARCKHWASRPLWNLTKVMWVWLVAFRRGHTSQFATRYATQHDSWNIGKAAVLPGRIQPSCEAVWNDPNLSTPRKTRYFFDTPTHLYQWIYQQLKFAAENRFRSGSKIQLIRSKFFDIHHHPPNLLARSSLFVFCINPHEWVSDRILAPWKIWCIWCPQNLMVEFLIIFEHCPVSDPKICNDSFFSTEVSRLEMRSFNIFNF